MSEREHDVINDGGEGVTYTLRNIPTDTGRVVTDLASHARKPKATFLYEFLEDSFRNVIDSFALKNPLITPLDEELVSYLDAKVMEQRYQSHFITRWNQEYQKLLGISMEEELRRLVLNNTPFLQVRANQVLKGWKNIPRGTSLTFSLFAEIVGRDRETINRAWRNILYSQLREKEHRFYQDIEAVHTLKKLPALTGNSWTRDGITVRIYRPENYARGVQRVTLSLPENYATQMWSIPFPELEYRFLTTDPGYSALVSAEPDRWDKAFRFMDGVCELHLYTNGVEEDHNPTPLGDIAQALINVVEENLL